LTAVYDLKDSDSFTTASDYLWYKKEEDDYIQTFAPTSITSTNYQK